MSKWLNNLLNASIFCISLDERQLDKIKLRRVLSTMALYVSMWYREVVSNDDFIRSSLMGQLEVQHVVACSTFCTVSEVFVKSEQLI